LQLVFEIILQEEEKKKKRNRRFTKTEHRKGTYNRGTRQSNVRFEQNNGHEKCSISILLRLNLSALGQYEASSK
jgi:hypothetical protein